MNKMIKSKTQPRKWLTAVGAVAAAMILSSTLTASAVDPTEVKIGVVMPVSGPWARMGSLYVDGAKLAVDHINAQGGIKSLRGARMKLIIFDAGDGPEPAKNAAQRMVAQEPDLVAAAGSWLSTLTLAVSEVTERAKLPLITGSEADQITGRGFKYIFRSVPNGLGKINQLGPGIMELAEAATGRKPTTVVMISDNTAAAANWSEIFRKEMLPKAGVKILVDEVYTPPLSDATPLIQKLRRVKADVFLLLTTNVADSKLMLEKLTEFGIKIPVFFPANPMASSEVPSIVAPKILEGSMMGVNNWGTDPAIVSEFRKRTGEAFMAQDGANGYGDMWVLKEAIERAKAPDREKVAQAMREIDIPINEGIGRYYSGGKLKFDEKGDRVNAGVMIVQWQGGKIFAVWPPAKAKGIKAIWQTK
jgi:branched-chain amino acid transport system substrate-binding protein